MTPTPGFKVALFFDAEYLRNGTRYRHSFNGILIGTYTCPIQQCHFEWPWVILSHLAKYSMKRSIARPLCDSWATCWHCDPTRPVPTQPDSRINPTHVFSIWQPNRSSFHSTTKHLCKSPTVSPPTEALSSEASKWITSWITSGRQKHHAEQKSDVNMQRRWHFHNVSRTTLISAFTACRYVWLAQQLA